MTQTDTLYCYVHPNRPTSLRCNRCERPICAECAVRTPTGYRCPECIRSQQKIFDTAKGSGPRSLILLRNFLDTGELAEEGRLLDYGCSNGNPRSGRLFLSHLDNNLALCTSGFYISHSLIGLFKRKHFIYDGFYDSRIYERSNLT